MPNEALLERLELERFLPYRLSVLTNRISDAIARQYSERFDLTAAEWRVMAALGNTPGLSSSEVAARTAMDKVFAALEPHWFHSEDGEDCVCVITAARLTRWRG